MIRVTFDLLPGGDESRARCIGKMEIINIKTYSTGYADYAVIMTKTPPFNGALRAAWKKGRLSFSDGLVNAAMSGEDEEIIIALATGHHRTRRGIYDLLFKAMKACGLEEREKKVA